MSHTKAEVKKILVNNENVHCDCCMEAKEAWDAHFEPPNHDTFDFIPHVSPKTVPGGECCPSGSTSACHGHARSSPLLDLEELTHVLGTLQHSIGALSEGTANSFQLIERNMLHPLSHIESLENWVGNGTESTHEGFCTPNIVSGMDHDPMVAEGSQWGKQSAVLQWRGLLTPKSKFTTDGFHTEWLFSLALNF